jgi:hypothetical protein
MIKPEVVDKVLGAGTYAIYEKILDALIVEQTRAYTNEKMYSSPWAMSLKTQLQADLALAEKVNDDYLAFLERVSSGGTANVTEGEKILSVFLLAISILTLVNDVLRDMFALGIVYLFNVLLAASVETEARAIQSLVKKLQQELEKAKREVKEAELQLAINVSIAAALAYAGPLGWLTLGAIGLGQMVADTYLGPSTSDAATWGSRGSTTLGTAASASQKYLQESSKVFKVVKRGGKVIPVVGVIFDVNEIGVGYRNVDGLKKLMADVKKAQDKLIEKIDRHKASLSALALKLGELRREVEKRGKGWTAQTRETLEDAMRRSGYRPRI